ncbi:MAG: nicotinate-nucleotide adenylyltransferase [Lachnospiraceae bacterium]|nr:nicotinate-nucleotide adenylyltransferase [Lachnospiraceae bacterium]
MDKKKKIGIMGGTFDPIHIGHLIMGETAYWQYELDQVWFMPAGNPPHKQNRVGRADDKQRVDMVKLAIASNPHFELSMEEMNADGYTYSYRTLERLNKENPDTEFYFIIGADSLRDFDTWKEPARIAAACNIVVATRNQTKPEIFDAMLEKQRNLFHGNFLKLDTPNLDISSNTIRERIHLGQTIRYYVSEEVRLFIEKQKIYGELK